MRRFIYKAVAQHHTVKADKRNETRNMTHNKND